MKTVQIKPVVKTWEQRVMEARLKAMQELDNEK